MTKFIAVNDIFTVIQYGALKREALMFDRIVIPQFGKTLDGLHKRFPDKSELFAEFDWLMEQEIVFDPDIETDEETLNKDPEYRELFEVYFNHLVNMDAAFRGITPEDVVSQTVNGELKLTEKGEMAGQALRALFGLQAREMSLKLRLLKGFDAYPVLSSFMPPMDQQNHKTNVIEVVLKEFPVPDEQTAWERIDEFRKDPDSRSKFLALKEWINEVSRMELPSNEVEDKIAAAMSDYTDHINRHRIKLKWDTLKTIVYAQAFTGGGYLAGWGKLGVVAGVVKPLFSIKEYQIKLLEAEQTAPGREVAYIIKTKETF